MHVEFARWLKETMSRNNTYGFRFSRFSLFTFYAYFAKCVYDDEKKKNTREMSSSFRPFIFLRFSDCSVVIPAGGFSDLLPFERLKKY